MILCGGKGTRMQSRDKHKVCFEINGRPAIHHSMDQYMAAGIDRFMVVTGTMAGQVVSCIGSQYDGVSFAYQKEASGTGNAARVGWNSLQKLGVDGPVLITMGDKIIDASVVSSLLEHYISTKADLVFAVQPRSGNPFGGHIVEDEQGQVWGICENLDIQAARLIKQLVQEHQRGLANPDQAGEWILKNIQDIPASEKKRQQLESDVMAAFSALESDPESGMKAMLAKSQIQLGQRSFDPDAVSKARYVNAALYLFSPAAFAAALQHMNKNNAAREEYLTDMVNWLCQPDADPASSYNVSVLPVQDETKILTYNNVEQLLSIENILGKSGSKEQLSFSVFKPVSAWIRLFQAFPQSLSDVLMDVYGENADLINERRQAYLSVLQLFAEKYGADRSVIITRSPGRVNLMGRHIEHRGGHINVISINKEVIAVASPAADKNIVRITNTQNDFPDRSFDISEHFTRIEWDNWLNYLDSGEIKKMVMESRGDWVNYVKAPILRLQYLNQTKKLSGMDIAFTGNIPVAAGLSSSSAVVVATAEASVALNKLDVSPQKFVDLCGEGEWFVGSRGGAGDHAAMKYGERGMVTTLGFFPFGYQGSFRFPDGYSLLIANSFVKANKTTNAKDIFNQRVASYEFAMMMIKYKHPEFAPLIKRLRDIRSDTLGVMPSHIYELIMELPEQLTPDEVFAQLPETDHNAIRQIMSSHQPPEHYLIRSVAFYGLAECQRARMCQNMLSKGDFAGFGRLMQISHDGDRVAVYDDEGLVRPYDYRYSDSKICALIDDLRSEDPDRVTRAQIAHIPGGYACSTEEVDFIVDTARCVPGVIGAQLSGAGLGGCVMILVKDEAVKDLIETLNQRYYQPRELADGITVCFPVKGSGLIEVK
jgi:N-acetylgalactosamine kinase